MYKLIPFDMDLQQGEKGRKLGFLRVVFFFAQSVSFFVKYLVNCLLDCDSNDILFAP
ncbi:hypothetical protein Pint_04794 [Pistacia integerrima]|uniref:Uncharacterized protein n=1 Tax=Pistacia integerrima TaxID=434235 RepID=A0ACC0Z176_9ROSI|nr:hypothetical protein Pint_04794 [Pistacia integerrima]